MTKAQVEVITSVQRRRRWSRAEKERIVAAALEAGAVASEVARAAGIHTSQLFRWRQQLCERAPVPAAFNAVTISPEPAAASPPLREQAGVIEIEFVSGGRMRITGPVAASTVKALIAVLTQRKGRRR
jgi:transposase